MKNVWTIRFYDTRMPGHNGWLTSSRFIYVWPRKKYWNSVLAGKNKTTFSVRASKIKNKSQAIVFFLCDASCLLILPIFQSKARMNQSVCMVPITSSPLSISASHLVVTNPCLVCICICIITIIIIIDNYNNYIYIYYNMYVYIYIYKLDIYIYIISY